MGVVAAAGTVYGLHKGNEAERAQAEAELARRHAAGHARAAEHHRQRAEVADERSRKLAVDLALEANKQIARLMRSDCPPLRFEGCVAASTNGSDICIDLNWLLSGIVDAAAVRGAVWQRVVGVVAHEWYHFQDTQRGKRGLHEEELAADAFAGKTLARLDVVPDGFAELLRSFPQSRSHPAGGARAERMLGAHAKVSGGNTTSPRSADPA